MGNKPTAALCALALSSSPASAVVIGDKDWAQPYDIPSVSGATFDSIFDSRTGECDVDECRIENSDLTGFVWATTADVDELFRHHGFGLSTTNADNLNAFAPAGVRDSFFSDFWFTNTGTTTVDGHVTNIERVFGLTRDQTAPDNRSLVYVLDYTNRALTDYAGLSFMSNNDDIFVAPFQLGGGSTRAWLYRPTSVPEPETALLLAGALAGLALTRRKRAK